MALSPEYSKKEVSTRAFKSALVYLRRHLGRGAMATFCADAGLPYEYLVDENNWVSLSWLNYFYQKMVEVTGNSNSPYESGLLGGDPEVWGSIYFLFRAVGSPGLLYRMLHDLTPSFNKVSKMELVRLDRNQVELAWHASGEHPFVCDNRRGQLVAVPTLWGLPPAQLVEDQCSARGAACCHYRISWVNRSGAVPALAVGLAAALGAWFGCSPIGAHPRWVLVALSASAAFLATRVWALARIQRDNAEFNRLQNDKLKNSMLDIEQKYDEVRKASQLIEDLNVNLERKVEDRTSALQKAQDELEHSYKKLQDVDRLKTQFFSNITHELRTPLTMILAPLEGLLDGELGNLRPHQRQYLEPIQRNALKLLKLINDLLDLAKLEEDYLRLRVEQTDLSALLTEMVDQARPLAARKDIALGLEVRKSSADLHLDLEKMERVLVNLISNALKFTEPSGHVDIWMDTIGGEVQIGVRDTGIGIPPESVGSHIRALQPGRWFEHASLRWNGYWSCSGQRNRGDPRRTSHGNKPRRSWQRVRGAPSARRGAFEARNPGPPPVGKSANGCAAGRNREPREWTQLLLERKDFRFLEIEEATDRRVAVRGEPGPRPSKILVVEDSVDVLQFLNVQLKQDHDVYLAQNGVKGLELANRELPDVIVTDYMMPEMDGLSLIRELRANPHTKHIPIVMLTAKSHVQDRIDARQAGAEIYLSKPFSPRELRSAVSQLLEQQGRQLAYAVHEQIKSLELISAGLAHEINNPLNYIRTALHVMMEATGGIYRAAVNSGSDNPLATEVRNSQRKVEQMQQVAVKGVEKIKRIVELVRNYARDGYPSEPTPLCLDSVIKDIAPLLSTANEHEIEVTLDLQATGARVKCLPEEMHQAIGNLWQNALDAVGPGGHVKIRTRIEGADLLLEVVDDGKGIPRDQLSRIFVPFYTTKDPARSLGLGLPIAYRVINQAGGTLTVESEEQMGTIFRARLPTVSLAES